MSTDQIADMFTCLRNARIRNCKTTSTPYSKFKWRVCQRLFEESFLSDCWVKLKVVEKGLSFSSEGQKLIANLGSSSKSLNIPEGLKISFSDNLIHVQGSEKKQIGDFISLLLNDIKGVHAYIKMEVNQSLEEIVKISKSSQEVFFNKNQIKKKCLGKRFYLISTSLPNNELVLVDYKKAREINFGGKVIGLIRKN